VTEILPQGREPKELRSRAAVAAVAAALLFSVLGARLYWLQVVHGAEYAQKSRENFIKELVEPADRGLVLDRRGRIIADNRPSFDAYLTPGSCPRSELVDGLCRKTGDVLDRLAVHLALAPEDVDGVRKAIRAMRRSKERQLELFRPYLVKMDITRDELDVVESDRAQLEGVDVIPSPHRHYRYGPMLAHVVGYMSEVSQAEFEKSKGKYRRGDFIGRRGLERSMEKYLRGVDGLVRKPVDAKQRDLDPDTAAELMRLIPEEERRKPSRPGNNLVLSIDLGLQQIADQAMRAAGLAGALVVVDVHTGFVYAMVSHPAYDPNRMTGRISRADLKALVDDPLEPLFQRAIQQHYHPGSTFKVVTALAGLERGLVTPESATGCSGGYSLGARRWRCHKDSGHGAGINLRRSLIYSCDSYYYWLADKLGLDPIADMAMRLGFGKPSGLDIGPEAAGLVPTVAFHNRVDKGYTKGYALNAAIGQGAVNVTPLQLALAYAAIANGGTLYRPRILRRIESNDGKLVEEFAPEVVRDIGMKPAWHAALMDALAAVVAEPGGTAYSKRLVDVAVAGKTGTAQVVVLGEKRLKTQDMKFEERDHAWFASVAPAQEPEIAVVALNEHGGHGGADAAPMAMAVIQGYFDLKAREALEKQPLSAQAISELRPAPRYAWTAWMTQKQADAAVAPARVEAPDEPSSTAAEVADPLLLLGPKVAAPSEQPTPLELAPSPE
jgi:penicillin-binding protein 2